MIVLHILLFTILQSIHASKVTSPKANFVRWSPKSHFYQNTVLYKSTFQIRILNRLLCSTSTSTKHTPTESPQWLTELCLNSPLLEALKGEKGFFPDNYSTRVRMLFFSLLDDNVDMDKLVSQFLEVKCKQFGGWERICNAEKDLRWASAKLHNHLQVVRQNFKWSDFVPTLDDPLDTLRKVQWEGNDWTALSKVLRVHFNHLYSLEKYLIGAEKEEKEKLLAVLRDIQDKSISKVAQCADANDLETKIMARDRILHSFEKRLLTALRTNKGIFKNDRYVFTFYDQSEAITTTKFRSRFFNTGYWDRTSPWEEAFQLGNEDEVLQTMQEMLHDCSDIDLPIRYSSSIGRAQVWNGNQSIFGTLIVRSRQDLLDRLQFFFRNQHLICQWIGSKTHFKTDRIKDEDVNRFVDVISQKANTRINGPWAFLPEGFLPELTSNSPFQYARLSNIEPFFCIQKDLLGDELWKKFIKALKLRGECFLVAQEMEEKLEKIITGNKPSSEEAMKELDTELYKIETSFQDEAKGCIRWDELPFVEWKPASEYYRNYFGHFGEFKYNIVDRLFCSSSDFMGAKKRSPEWLEEQCRSGPATTMLRHNKPSDRVGSLLMKRAIKSLLGSDNSDRIELAQDILKRYCTVSGVCDSEGMVHKKVLDRVVNHVDAVAKHFKWSDFIEEPEDLLQIAESIKWDGSDWGPLLKITQMKMNELYKLQKYLNGNDEDSAKEREEFKRELQSLKDQLVSNLKRAASANENDVVHKIMATDSIIESFVENLRKLCKEKLSLLPSRRVFGIEPNLARGFQSRYFSSGHWARNEPFEQVFNKVTNSELEKSVLESITGILLDCQESPFRRYATTTRYMLWSDNRVLFHNLLDVNPEDRLEGLLFFFKNHKLFCKWTRSREKYNQADLGDDQIRAFAKLVGEAREKIKGPMDLLPKDFYPTLSDRSDQYAKLSNGLCNECIQKTLLQYHNWDTFLAAVNAKDGACLRVAQNSDKELEELTKEMKWESEEDLYKSDARLKEFEMKFVEKAKQCVHWHISHRTDQHLEKLVLERRQEKAKESKESSIFAAFYNNVTMITVVLGIFLMVFGVALLIENRK